MPIPGPGTRETSAVYQKRRRDRLRREGLIKRELWIRPEQSAIVREIEAALREGLTPVIPRTRRLAMTGVPWSVETLFASLTGSDPVRDGSIEVERVEGAEPALLVTMRDFGDLPIVVAVAGGEIEASALLWPMAAVRQPETLNYELLQSHKLLPLSTFGIIQGPDGKPWYELFGSLSASSPFQTVLEELETLADNVIDVTEAYQDRLLPRAA